MDKIIKPQDFFTRNYALFYGGFYLVIGAALLFRPAAVNHYLYLGLGGAGFIVWYLQRRKVIKTESYISWDQEKIRVKESGQLYDYRFEEIDTVFLEKGHLRIKSGAAKGTMLDVQEYKEEDLQKLKDFIDAFPSKLEVSL